LKFIIKGDPHPQGRPRGMRMGKAIRIYEATKDRKWKQDAAKQIIAQLPIDESRPLFRSGVPVRVMVQFCFTCPKSDHRKREPKGTRWHAKKPDIDNLIKSVLDAANGILWADDGQVVWLSASKYILAQDDEEPHTSLTVDPLSELET